MNGYDVDLFVIGAGSGGVRAARMAAGLGVRVAIAENQYLGGTCVNVGAYLKNSSFMRPISERDFAAAKGFGWSTSGPTFDWSLLLAQKNREIHRLQGVYEEMLDNSGVQVITGQAQIMNEHTVVIGEQRFRCERILIATGAQPSVPDILAKNLSSLRTKCLRWKPCLSGF